MGSDTFLDAVARIDAAHADDPARVTVNGRAMARELHYADCMSAWLLRLRPDAPEALRLAVRAQHLRRWEVPRASYPEGRAGYHKWRTDLMRKHAALAGELLTAAGYGEEVVARTRSLIEKRALRSDPDAQALEDAACLVFLELDYAEFVAKHDDDDKILGILRKTWSKMSDAARSLATTVPLVGRGAELLARALEGE